MTDIRTYAEARGIKPATVLQLAARLSGHTWAKWEAGTASCTVRTIDRIREYMRANPPSAVSSHYERAA